MRDDMINIRIRPEVHFASGRREGWIKHVTTVETTVANGYAFGGEFLRAGRETELPAGAVLLRVDPRGSVKNGWKEAHVLRLQSDGSLTELTDDGLDWRDDLLTIRDVVAGALNDDSETSDHNPLATVSDDDLVAEARRRGLIE